MTEKQKSLDLIAKEDDSIIKEAQKWIISNKGTKVHSGFYPSPRVSSEIIDCSMPMTFDHLSFCSLGCTYCFAYSFKSNNPSIKEVKLRSVDTKSLMNVIRGKEAKGYLKVYNEHFLKKKFLLHWGGLADPFCYFEKNNFIGYDLIECLGEENYPTLFSFKGDAVLEKKYLRLFRKFSDQRNFAFQISMVTGDDEMGKLIEIGVPAPSKRLKAMRILSDMGYWTILRLRPFIIGITDETLDETLERSLEAGIKGISTEFFALDCRMTEGMKKRYDWMGKLMGIKDIYKYFSELSPSPRGGYKRLNRFVKEFYVKKIYKFCMEHNLVFGCSDPDFKELNTSGSCCAMPDKYEPNPLLQNWTRSQLTYHLKEARKLYHVTGEVKKLRFCDVFGKESWFHDNVIAQDHVCTISYCNADRKFVTYESILKRQWNNLRSPANPRNYFDGKLLPCGLDDNGDILFKYNPMEYEERWKAEGIDLTR